MLRRFPLLRSPLLIGAVLALLPACGGETSERAPAGPPGPYGTGVGQTLKNVSLPDCSDRTHDLHSFYQQGSGLLVVMTMGVG